MGQEPNQRAGNEARGEYISGRAARPAGIQ
jgi:hypothetical protein